MERKLHICDAIKVVERIWPSMYGDDLASAPNLIEEARNHLTLINLYRLTKAVNTDF